jgi:hypothetical protein
VVWEKAFEKYRILILTSSFLGITGKLKKNGATVYVALESYWRPGLEANPQATDRREAPTTKSRDFH